MTINQKPKTMTRIWIVLLGLLFVSTSAIAQDIPPVVQPSEPTEQPAPQVLQPPMVAQPSSQPTGPAFGTYLRPDSPSFNARGSIGTAFDPNALWTSLSLEMQFDKFIAFGPTVQFGFSDITNYILGSVGPRFVLPFMSMEFFTGAGVGLSHRDQTGIQFTNFLIEYQIGAEYYFLENLSVGAAARMNFISSRALDNIPVIMGSISGHF